MIINALIAFNSNQIEDFLDNFRFTVTGQDALGNDILERTRTDFAVFDDDNGHTLNPYDRNQLAVYVKAAPMWKENTQGVPTRLATVYIQDVTNSEGKLSMIEYLRGYFDGRFTPLGVWYASGAEYTTQDGKMIEHGQTITRATYDDNGDELTPEVVNGNGTYPLIPAVTYLKYMPDDVTYDEDGNEVSRTDAVEFKQVHLLQGHAPRGV